MHRPCQLKKKTYIYIVYNYLNKYIKYHGEPK